MAKEQSATAETKGPKTKVISCTCNHKSQDEIYGRKMRLHNKTYQGYRCSVCAKTK